MSNQLQAMQERGIRCAIFDDENDVIVFENGLQLPVTAYLDANREHETEGPVDGGWAAFGSDEAGWGYYPLKMISEEEWLEQQQ